MTIAESFGKILQRCDYTQADEAANIRHSGEVKRRLENFMDVSKVELMGSNARGSAIRQTSDIDLLAVLRKTEWQRGGGPMKSSTVLNNVRDQLVQRFPTTALGRDGQAITVAFADGTNVDVVPAGWVAMLQNNWPLYVIPDGSGGWMQTAPASHGKYIAAANTKSGGMLSNVARIFRYWTCSRQQPVAISGFHVELLMAAEGICAVDRSYSASFALLLETLAERECAALQDPLGISRNVAACGTAAKRDVAFGTVLACADRAAAAVESERNSDVAEARRLWNIVFLDGFPR